MSVLPPGAKQGEEMLPEARCWEEDCPLRLKSHSFIHSFARLQNIPEPPSMRQALRIELTV